MHDSDRPAAVPCPGCTHDVVDIPDAPLPRECRDTLPERAKATTEPSVDFDPVRRPGYYVRLSPEPREVWEAWDLPHQETSALKYIARSGYKSTSGEACTEYNVAGAIRDLEKAREAINRKLAILRRRRP